MGTVTCRKDDKTRHVAIVGSGPSGFYAAQALLGAVPDVRVDMFERLPVPYGLVRHGVAPDHQKLKSVTGIFEDISGDPRFCLFGNVEIDRTLALKELRANYHAVIIASGASDNRMLGIPGEELEGVHAASDFVGWYNGHPDYQGLQFDLSQETAVVIGNGNVALDVCRILLKTVDELRSSDITRQALEELEQSKVRNVYLVGRRSPAQAQFTTRELREFGMLDGAAPVVRSEDMVLNAASEEELTLAERAIAARNYRMLQQFAETMTDKPRRCHFRFLLSPRQLQGDGRLEHVLFDRNELAGPALAQSCSPAGDVIRIDAGLLFRAIGYRGTAMEGVAHDALRGTIPNSSGRVISEDGTLDHGLYVTGWIKRGPTGTIGTNVACAAETVESLLQDLPGMTAERNGRFALERALDKQRVVDLAGWRRIDALERADGRARGKPREKLTARSSMLRAALQ